MSDDIIENAVIQYQDYSGNWESVEHLGRSTSGEVTRSMQSVQNRLNGKRVRCIDRDSGRLVDIL